MRMKKIGADQQLPQDVAEVFPGSCFMLVVVEFLFVISHESAGSWIFSLVHAQCMSYVFLTFCSRLATDGLKEKKHFLYYFVPFA